MSPKRERKSLGRDFKRAFAQHSLESEAMGKHLLARIHMMIRVEMKNVLKGVQSQLQILTEMSLQHVLGKVISLSYSYSAYTPFSAQDWH